MIPPQGQYGALKEEAKYGAPTPAGNGVASSHGEYASFNPQSRCHRGVGAAADASNTAPVARMTRL